MTALDKAETIYEPVLCVLATVKQVAAGHQPKPESPRHPPEARIKQEAKRKLHGII